MRFLRKDNGKEIEVDVSDILFVEQGSRVEGLDPNKTVHHSTHYATLVFRGGEKIEVADFFDSVAKMVAYKKSKKNQVAYTEGCSGDPFDP